jgi:hypothetical protein
MASQFVKDTAKAMVLVSGLAFDGEAVETLDLNEDEVQELMDEIQKFCKKGLAILDKKYGTIPRTSSDEIISHIMFED